jgi:glycosyltransferase involved in cell wall biosynthesis
MKPSTLTVVCPVYNEQQVVEHFFDELRGTLLSIEHRYEWRVLFVVDRSNDETLHVLRRLAALETRVQVLGLSTRFGHQMSLVAGIDHAESDAVIMMDSDLQHPPELIPEMLDSFEEGYDVVYTVRREPADHSLLKRVGSRLFYRLLNWLAEIKLESGAADYRLISRRVAEVFRRQIRERNQFLRGLFRWVGFRQIGIAYEPRLRAAGVSKYSWSRMLRFAAAGIISFSKKPLQYAIMLGLLVAALGAFVAMGALVAYFVNDKVPSGWTTLAILISLFGGAQLFFLGLLGEYIGAIFDEVKGRPLYIIDEAINFE